ncbi:Transmembrane protein 242 [Eumeta japonica]|uniref:Transmembrane protein 242 n=1 Tax=Eumeta variegata TaxID=151549 RepID=A0A4C1WZJ3_EUMVA|nr:Transmembrane protein 242 [Eumeta japonica]
MGLRRLITEFLWPPSSSIIRPWLPYSIKVLVKRRSNEPKLDGVASFNYGVPMATFSSIIRPWLPYSIKVLVKTIKRAQTRWATLRPILPVFFGKDSSKRFFDIAKSYPYVFLRSAASYEPLQPYHFIRRPRNVFTDPPNALTLELIPKKVIIFQRQPRKTQSKGGAFLATVAGISAIAGFSATLAVAKKSDAKYFNKGLVSSAELADTGAILALRALGWGTLYAVTGTSLICYGIWKLSGAKDLKDFRVKMGQLLPTIPKNDPPKSRTEFKDFRDFMNYVATEKFGEKLINEEKDTK